MRYTYNVKYVMCEYVYSSLLSKHMLCKTQHASISKNIISVLYIYTYIINFRNLPFNIPNALSIITQIFDNLLLLCRIQFKWPLSLKMG